MTAELFDSNILEAQDAIYRVALSLDSFFVNGIPNGVIHYNVFGGFLEKTASTLMENLKNLDTQIPHAPLEIQGKTAECLAALTAKCRHLVDVAGELVSFRTMTRQRRQGLVSQLPLLRSECIQIIENLEGYFRSPKPFYPSRPTDAALAVSDFMANLQQLFEDAYTAPTVTA